MSDDVYMKLLGRLNQNPARLPALGSVLDLLRDLCNEEQAALAAEMPLGSHTLKSLAGLLDRDEARMEQLLEEMADEGVIFIGKTPDNQKEYAVMPFAPGILELQFFKGEETEKARRRAKLIAKMHEELDVLLNELYKDVETANKKMGTPGLRTLAVEEELPSNAEIASWERITEIIEREDSFAVGTCTCRQQTKFEGHPCKIKDVPMETCVFFGKSADFIVDRGFGRRLSREDLIALLKECEKYGLIHNINNFLGNNIVLCNCCGCCCEILVPMIKHRGLKRIMGSNFVSVVEPESCIGCGECVDICQVGAIELKEDIAVTNSDYCMGCGNCVSLCPTGSLSLVRCSDYKPREQREDIVAFGR